MSLKSYWLMLCVFLSINSFGQNDYFVTGAFHVGVTLNQNINLPEFEEGFGIGVQARVSPLSKLNIELHSNIENIDLGNVGNLKRKDVGLSGFYYLSKGRLSPFIFLGVNYYNTKVTPVSYFFSDRESEIVEVSSLGVHGGVGAQYFLNNRFSISMSYKYQYGFERPLYEIQSNDFGLYLNTSILTSQELTYKNLMYLQFSMNYKIFKLWD